MAKLPPPTRTSIPSNSAGLDPRNWGLLKDISKNRFLYIMLIPVLLYFAVFHYFPMYGASIAFKEFFRVLASWVVHGPAGSISNRFNGIYFWRVVKIRC